VLNNNHSLTNYVKNEESNHNFIISKSYLCKESVTNVEFVLWDKNLKTKHISYSANRKYISKMKNSHAKFFINYIECKVKSVR